jgi:beta-barrel assembly-enhancing protease
MDRKIIGWLFLFISICSFPVIAKPYTATFDPGYRPDISSDEGGFWYQVDKFEESVKVSPDRITDPELNKYVQSITCKLAGEYCPYIRVYIIRSPHFNASMYPNGMMHVWSGLFLRVNSEAELAAVLSHEIAHFLRSHQITQWRKLRKNASAAIFADLILTMGLATLSVAQNAMSFSRTQETEADIYGLELMAKTGYLPDTASHLWAYVYKESESDTSKEKRSVFFASHPQSQDRMNLLAKKAAEVRDNAREYMIGDREYVAAMEPHYLEFMRAHLSLQDLGRTEAMLERHTSMGFSLGSVEYCRGELYKLRNQKGDEEKAITAYRNSMSNKSHPVEVYRELGYLLVKTNPQEAKQYLDKYLELLPDASDKEMVQFYIDTASQ